MKRPEQVNFLQTRLVFKKKLKLNKTKNSLNFHFLFKKRIATIVSAVKLVHLLQNDVPATLFLKQQSRKGKKTVMGFKCAT